MSPTNAKRSRPSTCCARVDDDLHGRDELGAQQQKEHGQREQVRDEREHAVEGVAQHDDAGRSADHADRRDEEQDRAHSPSFLSGVRSSGSASSISLVKIRSVRS